MLVDTGSAWTTFDERHHAKLGTRVGSQRISSSDGGITSCDQLRIGGATLGGVRLSRASVALADDYMIEIFRKLFGYDDLDGVLGMDLLCGQIVQIDFDAGKLRLLSTVGNDCGRRVELAYRPSGTPVLSTTLADLTPRWFLADTGCASWNFCDEIVFSELKSRGAAHDIHPGAPLGKSGAFARKRWRVDKMQIGQFDVENAGFASAQINAIGLFYLSRFVVTFDFPGGALYMKEGKLFDRSEPSDMSGLEIIKYDGQFIVLDAATASPADDAGIVAGVEQLSLGGRAGIKY
jgi:hypothetical protein